MPRGGPVGRPELRTPDLTKIRAACNEGWGRRITEKCLQWSSRERAHVGRRKCRIIARLLEDPPGGL